MTKIERDILSKKISTIIKSNKHSWTALKEQILDFGYQPYYIAQDSFTRPINLLIDNLTDNQKKSLIANWKDQKSRIQFITDQEYLEQYKVYVIGELVSRATKAAYR